jgi:hypothetical protein
MEKEAKAKAGMKINQQTKSYKLFISPLASQHEYTNQVDQESPEALKPAPRRRCRA